MYTSGISNDKYLDSAEFVKRIYLMENINKSNDIQRCISMTLNETRHKCYILWNIKMDHGIEQDKRATDCETDKIDIDQEKKWSQQTKTRYTWTMKQM